MAPRISFEVVRIVNFMLAGDTKLDDSGFLGFVLQKITVNGRNGNNYWEDPRIWNQDHWVQILFHCLLAIVCLCKPLSPELW